MEKKISSYLRRWLGLLQSLSSIVLYRSTNTTISIQGANGRIKTKEVMMFKNLKNPKVATAGIEVRTNRRRNAPLELQIAEERLRHKALVGRVAVGCTGLGYCTNKDIRRTTGEEYRHLLQNEGRAGVKELRFDKIVVLGQ